MRRAILLVVVAVVIGVVVPALSGSAHASSDISIECGASITTDVVLTHDLYCDDGFGVYVVGATLDLDGHKLVDTRPRSDQSCAHWLDSGFSPGPGGCFVAGGGTIRNGTIEGSSAGGLVFERVTFQGPEVVLMHSQPVVGNLFVDTTVIGNQRATIERNLFLRSGIVLDNLQHGVTMAISGNLMVDSPGHAIDLRIHCCYGPDDIGGSITRNVIINSGDDAITSEGRWSDGYSDFEAMDISHNIVWGSKGHGIDWQGEVFRGPDDVEPWGLSGPISIHHNVVVANQGHGILAGPITEGNVRGNVALFNQARPQCVNVRCSPSFFAPGRA